MTPQTDIEIARAATKLPIQDIGTKLGIPAQDLLPCGHDKAQWSAEIIAGEAAREGGRRVQVTADDPTAAGDAGQTATGGRAGRRSGDGEARRVRGQEGV